MARHPGAGRRRRLAQVAPAIALLAPSVALGAGILGTSHDFTTGAMGFTAAEACNVCHTPHGWNPSVSAWAWGHALTSASFTMYTSETTEAAVPAQPGDGSLVCLSCHDGTVAVDAYAQNPGTHFIESGSTGYLTTDLSDDHPISIPVSAEDPDLQSPADLPLFDARVECVTCHDPHDDSHGSFLRKSNAASALCLRCHLK